MSTPRRPENVVPLAERGQAFLHGARGLRGLSPDQLARIARRLEAPRPRRQRPIVMRVCATAALVLAAATAVAWASGALNRLPGLGALGRRAERGAPPEVSGSPLEEATDPSPFPAPSDEKRGGAPAHPADQIEQPAVTRPRPHKRTAAPAPRPAAAPAEPPESPIVLEGRSFGRALELWRARRDAKAALAALDAHDRRFASGQMRTEALVLRAEILLASRSEREALAALDQISLDEAPRARELLTLRGELRARFDRCEDARADLTAVARGTDGYAARARSALVRCP